MARDNYSFLDVVGKVLGHIQDELQVIIAEALLADSQCGFQKGRGCVDMIFCDQAADGEGKRTWGLLVIMFVDLKRAYDSVLRNVLWTILAKCGVSPTMLSIIWSFHDGLQAGFRVGTVTDNFEAQMA